MAQQLVIRVEDNSIMSSLRKILNLMQGVSIVDVTNEKEQPLSAYEQSLDDVRNGRVNTYKSTDEFFAKMGI